MNWFLPGSAVIILLVTDIHCQTTSLSRASFGEPCDRSTRCDSRASLTCSENTCRCVKPDEMTYDKAKGKCVVLSGERCTYTAVEMLTDQTQEKRWTEKLDCVNNAVCNNEGYCDCRNEFYEDPDGGCTPKRSHEEKCTKDDECRTDQHLTCLHGKCSCNQTEAVFDPAYKQCVARSGASCVKYERCVRNAYCPRRNGYYGSSYSYDLCTCSPEYKRSKDGLCLARYGRTCDIFAAPCAEEFVCTNGKCSCHFPQHQTYEEANGNGQCVSSVRGPCVETVEGSAGNVTIKFACTTHAVCKSDKGISQCICNEGYIESLNRKCRVPHGQPCSEPPSNSRETSVCDPVANLVCKNGKCACQDLQVYDSALTKCRGLVGSMCQMNSKEAFCVEGATCKSYRDPRLEAGTCECVPPALPDNNRGCTTLVLLKDERSLDVSNGTVESVEEEMDEKKPI